MAGDNVALTSPTLLGALWDPNNEAAWRTFLQRYQPLIGNWCRRRGLQGQDAEDVSATVARAAAPQSLWSVCRTQA